MGKPRQPRQVVPTFDSNAALMLLLPNGQANEQLILCRARAVRDAQCVCVTLRCGCAVFCSWRGARRGATQVEASAVGHKGGGPWGLSSITRMSS